MFAFSIERLLGLENHITFALLKPQIVHELIISHQHIASFHYFSDDLHIIQPIANKKNYNQNNNPQNMSLEMYRALLRAMSFASEEAFESREEVSRAAGGRFLAAESKLAFKRSSDGVRATSNKLQHNTHITITNLCYKAIIAMQIYRQFAIHKVQ